MPLVVPLVIPLVVPLVVPPVLALAIPMLLLLVVAPLLLLLLLIVAPLLRVLLLVVAPLLPIALGNVLTDSLHDIWYASPELWKIRAPSNLKGRCSDCKLVPICRGCRAMALAVHGDWMGENPQC